MSKIWFGHFDSTEVDVRELTAEDWAAYMRTLITDGIRNGGTNLQVSSPETGLYIQVNEGMHTRKDDDVEQATSKAISISVIAVLTYVMESLNTLFFIMVFMLFIDYITGLIAGAVNKNLSSRIGIMGILKKLGYIFLVFTAFLIDLTLINMAQKLGLTIPVDSIFGVLVMGWLITNESISVLENLTRSGVKVPMFLKKALKNYRDKIEDVGDNATKPLIKEDD